MSSRSPGSRRATAVANARCCPVPTTSPAARNATPSPTRSGSRSTGSAVTQHPGQVVGDALYVVMVLNDGTQRVCRGVAVELAAEHCDRTGPADRLRDTRLLDQVELADAPSGGTDPRGEGRRDLGSTRADDVDLAVELRIVDPVVEAATAQRVVQLSRAVRGQHHDRRRCRAHRPDLRDGHLKLGQQLEEKSLELLVGAVDLVDEQDSVTAHPQGGEQRALDEETLAEDVLRVTVMERAQVHELPRVVPLVERLVRIDALVTLQPDERRI